MSTRALVKTSEEAGAVFHTEMRPTLADHVASPASTSASARKRVLLIASGGGHWIELTRLAEAFRHCQCAFVSTAPNLIAPIGDEPVIKVTDGSRDTLRALVSSCLQLWRIIRARRPDVIVSTGAAPGAIAVYIAKLHGIRTIWIDSVANCDELSLSGRAVLPVADLCLTQWPHLASRDRRLRYFGRVL